jgi:hypothetical protein
MTTAMNMTSDRTVLESSSRIKEEENDSNTLSASRCVMNTAHLVAATVLHLHGILV